jgi:pimeloyl-ACP methyl ester carboxylesterase
MRIAAKRRSELMLTDRLDEDDRITVDSRGCCQEVVCLGRGQPIVLVPGLAGGVSLVSPLVRRLAKRYRVIVPALRGDRGGLGPRPPRDIAAHADDLGLTLDTMGLERPILAGVSFGGAIALEYAVTHPERIGGLVLWGTEARFRPTIGTTIARRVLERFPLPGNNPFLNQFFNLLHGGRPESAPLADFIVERCWRTDPCVVAHRIALLDSFDVTERLWRIDAPTLVIAGSRDVVIPPARQRALAGAIAGASYAEVEGAGHVGFLTHRVEVTSRLGAFLRSVRRSYC